jgi:tetratricopeptide repeat protein
MKYIRWTLAVWAMLGLAADLKAQVFFPGGYAYHAGLGFGYHRRHLAVGGFIGNTYLISPYALGFYGAYPFGPIGMGYGRVTINYITPPATPVVVAPAPGRQRPAFEDDDVAGVDLDLVPPKKKPAAPPAPPPALQEPPKMPGKNVSVPRDVVRPEVGPARPRKAPPPEPPPAAPQNPAVEAVRLLELGKAAFHEGLYGVAGFRFRQAAHLDPQSARARFLLSQADFALGQYAEAVKAIELGMKLKKDWPVAWPAPRLDLYANHEADFAEHLKRLENAEQREPNHPVFLFLLAHQRWMDGQRDRAVPLFRRARDVATDPSFCDAFLRVAGAGQVAAK